MFYSRSKNRRKRVWRSLMPGQRKLLIVGGILLLPMVALLVMYGIYAYRASQFDLERVGDNFAESSRYPGYTGMSVHSQDGKYIADLYGARYTPVTLQQLPKNLINAFIAREDESFYSHNGIVYSAVLRSLLINLSSMRYEQGASTITMQLTRNVFEMQDKTLDRKILEAFVARRIENQYDKNAILLQYLNRIYFGENCYGVGTAAAYYFGKDVSELSLAECATLAGLVRGPSIFNPVASMNKAVEVKRETLNRMYALEYITQEQRDAAIAEPIVLATDRTAKERPVSSYISQWVRKEMNAQSILPEEGIADVSVVTTLNLSIQQYLETAVEQALTAVEKSRAPYPEAWVEEFKNEKGELQEKSLAASRKQFRTTERPTKNFKVRQYDDVNGALQCCVLVVDSRPNHCGEVLALSSGRLVTDGINRWNKSMQPGNAIAPLLLCAADTNDIYLLRHDFNMTGENTGYEKVKAFYESLGMEMQLPSEEQAARLYAGAFPVRRLDVARALFSIQNAGRDYDFYAIKEIINNHTQKALFVKEREPFGELIRRESADRIISDTPYETMGRNGKVLKTQTAEDCGYWAAVSNVNGVSVFVWLGYDNPSEEVKKNKAYGKLMERAALFLAKDLHRTARKILSER